MIIDIHVHTSRYSLCGRSSPDDMLSQAAALGIDGLVLTEHDTYWPNDKLAELQSRHPDVRLYSGIELTSCAGDDFLVIGPPRPDLFGPRMEAEAIVAAARGLGHVIILAHPYRYQEFVPQVAQDGLVDGLEVKSNNIHNYATTRAVALAQHHRLLTTCASDGHHTSMLGLYALTLDGVPDDEQSLAEMLRQRRFGCHTDRQAVATRNTELAERLDTIQEMIAVGADNDAIRARLAPYHVTYTILNGLREGRDVFWPM